MTSSKFSPCPRPVTRRPGSCGSARSACPAPAAARGGRSRPPATGLSGTPGRCCRPARRRRRHPAVPGSARTASAAPPTPWAPAACGRSAAPPARGRCRPARRRGSWRPPPDRRSRPRAGWTAPPDRRRGSRGAPCAPAGRPPGRPGAAATRPPPPGSRCAPLGWSRGRRWPGPPRSGPCGGPSRPRPRAGSARGSPWPGRPGARRRAGRSRPGWWRAAPGARARAATPADGSGGRWPSRGPAAPGAFAAGRGEPPVVGGEAAPGRQVELPAVHPAGEHAVLDVAELRQVRLQVRAAALDQVAVHLDQLLHRRLLRVPALGVLEPLRRQRLEPVVDVLVVGPLAGGLEAAGQEQLVHPVLFVVDDAGLHQRPVDPEAVAERLALPGVDPALEVVDHDLLVAPPLVGDLQQHPPVDALTGQVRLGEQGLPPALERPDDVLDLPPGPGRLATLDLGQLAGLVLLQIGALVGEDPLDRIRRRVADL